jgi:hypothetical protein
MSAAEYDIEKKAAHSGEVATEDELPHKDAGHMHRTLKARQVCFSPQSFFLFITS